MKDPDVVMRIDGDAADLSGDPLVRQRFEPQRIRLELRHLLSRGLRAREEESQTQGQ